MFFFVMQVRSYVLCYFLFEKYKMDCFDIDDDCFF